MGMVDPKDQRIAELEALLQASAAWIAELDGRLRVSLTRVAELEARVAHLEARLAQNSTNSSKPPSSDGPAKPGPPKPPTGRARGGQPGHKGHRRALLAADHVFELKPPKCEKCSRELVGEDPYPYIHQVMEIPRLKPDVSEYRRHALCCPDCHHVTRAALPAGVPKDTMGPRLKALAATLTAAFRCSKRSAAAFLADVLKVPISAASICQAEQVVAEALAKPVAEGQAMLEASAAANADETGWKLERARAWLWAWAGTSVVMFRLLASRSNKGARQLLGKFAGVLTTDRHGAYNWVELRQVCWAHLKRDFTALSQRPGDAHDWGLGFLAVLQKVFDEWHRFKDGKTTRAALSDAMQPHVDEVHRLIAEGILSEDGHLSRFCAGMERVETALWTFVAVDSVEPTNNHAERILRHAVILRKLIFGTDSPAGAVRLERLLSTAVSLRIQKRSTFDFLEQAVRAQLDGTAPPSLLPLAPLGSGTTG